MSLSAYVYRFEQSNFMWEQRFILTRRNKSSESLQVAGTFVTSNGNGFGAKFQT